jgi:mannose-6-phosphate isomerase-like protein (cupin superfamily)
MISKKPLYVQQPLSYVFLGVTMQIHLSGVQTGDEFSLIGATMPSGGDGGLHLHTREDESVHLLEGCLNVTIGEETFTMQAGQTYFAPRNVPHRLRNTSNVPARALLINTPGSFDRFVQMAGTPVSQDASTPGFPDPEQMQRLLALAGEFGVRILAPPELPTRN